MQPVNFYLVRTCQTKSGLPECENKGSYSTFEDATREARRLFCATKSVDMFAEVVCDNEVLAKTITWKKWYDSFNGNGLLPEVWEYRRD
jgi:hypothetical protein